SVQFLVDGSNFGSPVVLSAGVATISTSTLSVGPHTIRAAYSGDSLFLASAASLAQAVQYRFSGFLAPLNQNLTFALNRVIPIKFNLSDFNGTAVTNVGAVTSLAVAPLSSPPASAGNTGLHIDGSTFAFDWQTKGLPAGSYTIEVALAD